MVDSTRFYTNLRTLKDGWAPLCLIAARKASVVHSTGGHGARSSAPLPLNVGAWQLQQDIEKLVNMMVTAAGLHAHHAMIVPDLIKGLLANPGRLESRTDWPMISALVDKAVLRLARTLDPPPDTKMIGWCPQCGCELRCTPLEIAGGYTACERCGKESKIKEVPRASMARLAVGGVRGTAAEIVRWLNPWGIEVKRNTITQWGKRGRLQPVGAAPDSGAPIYLVWDIWQELNRKKE
ncbi:hypothetical protein D2E25_0260 [Bifidobacterium goeldii]|uniref:PhnA protein n=1 Tax=Bifidobacterium goeldii TaxID=2306975 RepID=A0A430FM24_9BIFI|nr:hypothetical protein [Bifidobacterium goeldii]RSX53954.1 hypothetical protein D2E25_0260 [Bifidobacterium goeldii]